MEVRRGLVVTDAEGEKGYEGDGVGGETPVEGPGRRVVHNVFVESCVVGFR